MSDPSLPSLPDLAFPCSFVALFRLSACPFVDRHTNPPALLIDILQKNREMDDTMDQVIHESQNDHQSKSSLLILTLKMYYVAKVVHFSVIYDSLAAPQLDEALLQRQQKRDAIMDLSEVDIGFEVYVFCGILME